MEGHGRGGADCGSGAMGEAIESGCGVVGAHPCDEERSEGRGLRGRTWRTIVDAYIEGL
jgi:hypothetical protein